MAQPPRQHRRRHPPASATFLVRSFRRHLNPSCWAASGLALRLQPLWSGWIVRFQREVSVARSWRAVAPSEIIGRSAGLQGIGVGCRRSSGGGAVSDDCSGLRCGRARPYPANVRAWRKRRPAALSISAAGAHRLKGCRRGSFPCCRIPAQSRQPTDTVNPHLQRGGCAADHGRARYHQHHKSRSSTTARPVDSRTVIGSADHRIAYLCRAKSAVLWTIDTVVSAARHNNVRHRHCCSGSGSRQHSGIVEHCTLLFSRCQFAQRSDGMLVAANQTGTRTLVGWSCSGRRRHVPGVRRSPSPSLGPERSRMSARERGGTVVQHLAAQAFESVFVSFSALGLGTSVRHPVEGRASTRDHPSPRLRSAPATARGLSVVLDTHPASCGRHAGGPKQPPNMAYRCPTMRPGSVSANRPVTGPPRMAEFSAAVAKALLVGESQPQNGCRDPQSASLTALLREGAVIIAVFGDVVTLTSGLSGDNLTSLAKRRAQMPPVWSRARCHSVVDLAGQQRRRPAGGGASVCTRAAQRTSAISRVA